MLDSLLTNYKLFINNLWLKVQDKFTEVKLNSRENKYKLNYIYSGSLIYLSTDEIIGTNLNIVSFLAILSSILVISTNNGVISVLFLISLFINVAIYLMLLGITFIGLTYIVVYVGAVTILFLFVIMLLDIKFSEISEHNNSDTFPLGLIVGLTFLYPLIEIIPKEVDNIRSNLSSLFNKLNNYIIPLNNNEEIISKEILIEEINKIDKVIINLWDNTLFSSTQITSIGQIMYNSHIIWFIIVSLILLLAMVGAISLTLKSSS